MFWFKAIIESGQVIPTYSVFDNVLTFSSPPVNQIATLVYQTVLTRQDVIYAPNTWRYETNPGYTTQGVVEETVVYY